MAEILKLFCDGGNCGPNPSAIGGVWSFLAIGRRDRLIGGGKGIILPSDIQMEKVSNNVAELFAAMKALEYVESGWEGLLHTDSKVTLHRITHGKSFNGIPNWMRLKVLDLRRTRKHKVILLKGHPSKEDLERGRTIQGKPVSCWNVECDRICNELAKEFMSNGK